MTQKPPFCHPSDTPKNEAILPENRTKNGLALYVHWPWCVKKCPYCDFNAHVNENHDETAYLSCILKELTYYAQNVSKNSLTSIFFGGGTPSLASAGFIEAIITHAKTLWPPAPDLEITLEVNPATYRPQLFHNFVAAGVTRFSIGVQSLNASELQFLGRAHDVNEALLTIEHAQKSGAEVSVDFIYGLPEQNLQNWENQLQRIAGMGTNHVSAYQLTIEPGTAFFGQVRKQHWQPLDDDRQADFFMATHETLGAHGFVGYEISNFARAAADVTKHGQGMLKACQHNLHVWRYGDYLGVGAGAHGRVLLVDGRRVATRNFKMPETYMREMLDNGVGAYECIPLNEGMAAQEAILNGLRLVEGVSIGRGDKKALNGLWESHFCWGAVERLVTGGFLVLEELGADFWHLRTTERGRLLLESILVEIVADVPAAKPARARVEIVGM